MVHFLSAFYIWIIVCVDVFCKSLFIWILIECNILFWFQGILTCWASLSVGNDFYVKNNLKLYTECSQKKSIIYADCQGWNLRRSLFETSCKDIISGWKFLSEIFPIPSRPVFGVFSQKQKTGQQFGWDLRACGNFLIVFSKNWCFYEACFPYIFRIFDFVYNIKIISFWFYWRAGKDQVANAYVIDVEL